MTAILTPPEPPLMLVYENMISRRDYFAAAALTGILSDPDTILPLICLEKIVEIADRLIAELDKKK